MFLIRWAPRIAAVASPRVRKHAAAGGARPMSTAFMTGCGSVVLRSGGPPRVGAATVLAAMLGTWCSSLSKSPETHDARYTPTSAYCVLEIEGFRIYVSPDLFDDSHGGETRALGAEALRALHWQLRP